MPAAATAARVTRSRSAANKTRGAGEKRPQRRPPINNTPVEVEEDEGDDDVDAEDSDSDDAPPEEVTRVVAEKETREEQLLKKRARETQQAAKEREKEKRVEKAKARTEAAAKRKREKEEKRKAEEVEEGKENEREEEEEEGAEEDPDAFTLDDDIVDAVAASENQLKEKYLRDFHDTKSQRKKRKKQMKRERMREEAMGRESAKFTTRDGFDVVIRSKVDELAEMKANPKSVDFARRRLDAKHRRDERMLCDTRTGKIKNQFAVR